MDRRPVIASLAEAREAVLAFEPELARSPALAARLAYSRTWVAVKADGGWRYAFSRWAGHRGFDAEGYLGASEALDGRRSDAALALFFAPVADPRRQEKHLRRLRELFARHGLGQAPNSLTRFLEIAVPDHPPERDEARHLVDLLEAVFRTLPVPAQAAFRKRIS